MPRLRVTGASCGAVVFTRYRSARAGSWSKVKAPVRRIANSPNRA
jgi:hypothetical protein